MITAIGSCRVYDPIRAMELEGRAQLNQQRVFGYVHNTREVLQQLRLMTGEMPLAGRLRPFLNVPSHWKWLPQDEAFELGDLFAATDCFVVEISSIRAIRFKAMYLQLNRTRELLVTNEAIEKRWWQPLVRLGRNEPLAYLLANTLAQMEPVHREVMQELVCAEQSTAEIVKDIRAIRDALPGPVLFVSHFNTDAESEPIEQRQTIVDAMGQARRRYGINFFDPTDLVLDTGPAVALLDGAHYQPQFVPEVGLALLAQVSAIVTAAELRSAG
ncbi:hypothetical protein [Devosia sp. CN2-171]|uniref:hypothetical protein n=1 Tax=Devosia sp. CN2-171 TaxID=3400909 RepID=UPI003BF7F4AF